MRLRFLTLMLMCTTLLIVVPTTGSAEPKSDTELAEDWLFNLMVKVAPPGRKLWYPDSEETKASAEQRYRGIARDIINVVYNPKVKVPFKGPQGRARTASLILSVMFHESGFTRHVDYGLGKYARGDQGNSWCLMQLNIGDGRTLRWNWKQDRPVKWNDPVDEIHEGYKGEELIEDRSLCIQEGLKVLRVSLATCRQQPILYQLSSYASGDCNKGHDESKTRMGTAIQFFNSTAKKRHFKEKVVQTEVVARLEKQNSSQAVARTKKTSTSKVAKTASSGSERPD